MMQKAADHAVLAEVQNPVAKMSLQALAHRNILHEDLLAAFFGAAWDEVLVPICGASNHGHGRSAFIFGYTDLLYPATEWRFQGALGFGGKFWCNHALVCSISCYTEDETPARLKAIEKAGEALLALLERFKKSINTGAAP